MKSFCQQYADHKLLKDLALCDAEWEKIQELVQILSPFNKYSKRLQSVQLALSDFYGMWTSLRIKLAKRADDFSSVVMEQMNKYNAVLMDNPLTVASIYLDPRYQRSLTDKKSLAQKVLSEMYVRLKKIEGHEISEENNAIEPTTTAQNPHSCDGYNSEDEINEFLNACESVTGSRNEPIRICEESDLLSLKQKLEEFDGSIAPLSTSIFTIWEQLKSSWPQIYTLASVILAIPPTQTTVERAFSALALVYSSLRTKLSDQSLQDILFVRLNYNLYEEQLSNFDFFIQTNSISQ